MNTPGDGQATATRAIETAMAMTWVMAMATRLADSKEGKGYSGKGDGNGDEGRATKRAIGTATRVMATTTRVVGKRLQWQLRE